MQQEQRRRGKTSIVNVSGGQAKGLWLSTTRQAKQGESASLFEQERTDPKLMDAIQKRWLALVGRSDGIAFSADLYERMVVGLGASHVLETGITLDRNNGLPYIPGSAVKGMARAWGLIDVATEYGLKLDQLNALAERLIEPHGDDAALRSALADVAGGKEPSKSAEELAWYFRFVFGSQGNAGAIGFLDAIYYGNRPPEYDADVMTPHYVQYYTNDGAKPPSDDDNPNPVSFLTVAAGNRFAFGLLPRVAAFSAIPEEQWSEVMALGKVWLQNGLTQLGAGAKTAAGYGFFKSKSMSDLL